MREADRIVSMKEDVDAMSWGRVTEIAKLLQADHTEEQRLEWARELLSIARTNSWVLDKFGVAAESMTGQVIPSGIEIQQDDRYLSETTAGDLPSASGAAAVEKGNAESVSRETAEPAVLAAAAPAAGDGSDSASPVPAISDPPASAAAEPGFAASAAVLDAPAPDLSAAGAPAAGASVGRASVFSVTDPAAAPLEVGAPEASAASPSAAEAPVPAAPASEMPAPEVSALETPAPCAPDAPVSEMPAPCAPAPASEAPASKAPAPCAPAPAESTSAVPAPDESFIETKGMLRKKRRAEKRAQRERRNEEAFSIPTAPPADDAVFGFEHIATPDLGQDATSLDELREAKAQGAPISLQAEPTVPDGLAQPAQRCAGESLGESAPPPSDRTDEAGAEASAPSVSDGCGESDRDRAEECASERQRQEFARFKHLYSNKKGSLCLYEDADGHLVAVDPSRFA